MSREQPLTKLKAWLRRLSLALALAPQAGEATVPSAARPDAPAIDRLEQIRNRLLDADRLLMHKRDVSPTDDFNQHLVQWLNWPNWPNYWSDWPNWNDWNDWSNWGNWYNY